MLKALFGAMIALSSSASALAVVATQSVDQDNRPADQDDMKWLFVLKADSMEFVSTSSDPEAVEGQLILKGLDPSVMAFTDRPYREAVMLTVDEMRVWVKDTFAEVRPNFAIAVDSGREITTAILMALGPAKVEGDRLVIEVESLLGAIPTSGERTSIFVDQVRRPVVVGPRPGPYPRPYPVPGPGPGPGPGGPGRDWYCSARNAQGTVFVGIADTRPVARTIAMNKCVGLCNITSCTFR